MSWVDFRQIPKPREEPDCDPRRKIGSRMSWQATAWAIQQNTGSARRKLLLLALANYADKHGTGWPSQETLALNTEQSVDSVQRQLIALERLKLLRRELLPRRRGEWRRHIYFFSMKTDRPAHSVSPSNLPPGRAVISTRTGPQSLRLKPSIEPPPEPSRRNLTKDAAERLQAFQGKHEGMRLFKIVWLSA